MRLSLAAGLAGALLSTVVMAQSSSALSLKEAVAQAAPIESAIQRCYGELSFFELTDDERIRMHIASAKLDNVINRFAKVHTVQEYERVELAFIELIMDYNMRPEPPPVCDSSHLQMVEKRTQEFETRFASIKGPRER